MSGFIDPDEPTRKRLDRLDALIDLVLAGIGLDALSPEARAVVEDLTSDDPERQERGRRAYRAAHARSPR